MGLFSVIRKDFGSSRGNSKGLFFILYFGMGHFSVTGNRLLETVGLPVRATHHFLCSGCPLLMHRLCLG
jgi:hypothetical protein